MRFYEPGEPEPRSSEPGYHTPNNTNNINNTNIYNNTNNIYKENDEKNSKKLNKSMADLFGIKDAGSKGIRIFRYRPSNKKAL